MKLISIHPDYYGLDELYSDEHKLVRDAARAWVKKEVSPIIDDCYEKAVFPKHLIPGLERNRCFWTLHT